MHRRTGARLATSTMTGDGPSYGWMGWFMTLGESHITIGWYPSNDYPSNDYPSNDYPNQPKMVYDHYHWLVSQ